MQKISSYSDLRLAIVELEERQAEEGADLKAHFSLVYESVKPINLIKSLFADASEPGELKDDIINASVGLSAGYISKLLFEGVTNSPFKKIIGTALMFGIKSLVAKNPEVVKSIGKMFFSLVKGMLKDHDIGEDTSRDQRAENSKNKTPE